MNAKQDAGVKPVHESTVTTAVSPRCEGDEHGMHRGHSTKRKVGRCIVTE